MPTDLPSKSALPRFPAVRLPAVPLLKTTAEPIICWTLIWRTPAALTDLAFLALYQGRAPGRSQMSPVRFSRFTGEGQGGRLRAGAIRWKE
jgi:hypothetical protein